MRSEASLLDAASRLARAEQEADLAALEDLVAPDYLGHDPAGRPQDRAGLIRALTNGSVKVAQLRQSQLTARVIGDVGLVSGVNALEGEELSLRFDLRLRFLDVYAWREERWQLIASQSTYLP
ncbi:MAG TPA: nuclear transport factor 2 family protein [Gemmatimonadales bacterium]|jgi:ketosteroid isomerase-like protein